MFKKERNKIPIKKKTVFSFFFFFFSQTMSKSKPGIVVEDGDADSLSAGMVMSF